jgi:hypothetical protein
VHGWVNTFPRRWFAVSRVESLGLVIKYGLAVNASELYQFSIYRSASGNLWTQERVPKIINVCSPSKEHRENFADEIGASLIGPAAPIGFA